MKRAFQGNVDNLILTAGRVTTCFSPQKWPGGMDEMLVDRAALQVGLFIYLIVKPVPFNPVNAFNIGST